LLWDALPQVPGTDERDDGGPGSSDRLLNNAGLENSRAPTGGVFDVSPEPRTTVSFTAFTAARVR
jgi:hypothetical protein